MLAGMNVVETTQVLPGEIYLVNEHGGRLVAHPLDVIAMTHPDPFDRLGAAMAWIVGDAHRKLERLERRLADA